MSKKIITPGATKYRAECSECGCVFTYEREDVRRNYARGGEYVSCPSCGHDCYHFGADAAGGPCWPTPPRRRWTMHVQPKEGERTHVIWWTSKGRRCSEPACEMNRPS